jgi:hypothetical protein
VQPLKLLPLGLVFIGACGSSSGPQPKSNSQPFSQITQASSTTQAELGVVEWWTTITPHGVMNIGGMDASHSERVEFITDATKLMLRGSHGTFEMDLDGDKVVSSNFGNAGARRTLDLMKMDLTPSDAAPSAAVSPASVSAGELHPTNDPCPKDPNGRPAKGSLIEDCSSLFHGDCDMDRFHACMNDSGSLKATYVDQALDSTNCANSLACERYYTERIAKWKKDFHNDKCDECAPQWLSTPDKLLNCPESAWDHNDDAYFMGWYDYNYCRPRIESCLSGCLTRQA